MFCNQFLTNPVQKRAMIFVSLSCYFKIVHVKPVLLNLFNCFRLVPII